MYFLLRGGHIPKWLNVNQPKLKIVKHSDYIPDKYLPTFSSDVIEMNLHRIKELSNNFVLFNDDMIINYEVRPEDFFKNEMPVDTYIEDIIQPVNDFSQVMFNNSQIINKYFNKKQVYKKNWRKIFNYRYGAKMIRNILLLPWSKFSSFKNYHYSQPICKKTLESIWEKEHDNLEYRCMSKFRSGENISQYLVKNWQLVSGEFMPGKVIGKLFNIERDIDNIESAMKKRKYKILCLNDSDDIKNFDIAKIKATKILEKKYPQKSGFEI